MNSDDNMATDISIVGNLHQNLEDALAANSNDQDQTQQIFKLNNIMSLLRNDSEVVSSNDDHQDSTSFSTSRKQKRSNSNGSSSSNSADGETLKSSKRQKALAGTTNNENITLSAGKNSSSDYNFDTTKVKNISSLDRMNESSKNDYQSDENTVRPDNGVENMSCAKSNSYSDSHDDVNYGKDTVPTTGFRRDDIQSTSDDCNDEDTQKFESNVCVEPDEAFSLTTSNKKNKKESIASEEKKDVLNDSVDGVHDSSSTATAKTKLKDTLDNLPIHASMRNPRTLNVVALRAVLSVLDPVELLRRDDDGCVPLALAIKHNATIEVMLMLLNANPLATQIADRKSFPKIRILCRRMNKHAMKHYHHCPMPSTPLQVYAFH